MRSRQAFTAGMCAAALTLAIGCGSSSSHPDAAVGGQGGTAGTGGGAGSGADAAAGGAGGSAGGAGGSAGGAGGSAGGSGGGAGGAGGSKADAGGAWLTPPTVPATLEVPAGATLKARFSATGAQIYTCTPSVGSSDGGADAGPTTYAWVLKAPDAKLFDEAGVQAGTHFAGPTWMSSDGSSVVGNRVAQENSPVVDAIPWLKLSAKSNTGTGLFGDVTWIQRVNTTKGKAPTTGCDATKAGTDTSVDYTADYYFYKGAPLATPDAGSTDATVPMTGDASSGG